MSGHLGGVRACHNGDDRTDSTALRHRRWGATRRQRGRHQRVSQGLTGRLNGSAGRCCGARATQVPVGGRASRCASRGADPVPVVALFLGDLGNRPQALMMAANRISTVDVVKSRIMARLTRTRGCTRRYATVGVIRGGSRRLRASDR
jgi:hypothetical protein